MKKCSLTRITALLLTVILIFSLVSCSSSKTAGSSDMNNAGGYYGSANNAASSDSDLSGESYTEIIENSFINTSDQASNYFSIDANTASYPNLRSMINQEYANIPADAVRVEEMLNYFNYDYKTPTDGSVLELTSSVFDTPYNDETKLLTIGLAATEVEFKETQNNLVFLIDTSGSMYSDDKLPLVQQAFMLLTENLNPTDRVSIVTYAGSDKVALAGAYGYEKQKIMAVIEDLSAGGSTAGTKGIKTAYSLASEYFIEGGNNRVILATDGDFNVGIVTTAGLERFISEQKNSGIYFSVFGFGRGNIQSDKMETLALKGNGTYSYIDSPKEARRALVQEMGGSMITVAKDVKAGITFNPEYVESYRLIGYENKLLSEEEFNDSNTDAGEIGSGHTVTVVYEIVMTDKALAENGKIADVIIKYKPTENVGGNSDAELEKVMTIGAEAYHATPTANDIFVASVIEFALIIRDSEYKANSDLNALISRLMDLDLSSDEFKEEFRDIVIKYRSTKEKQN